MERAGSRRIGRLWRSFVTKLVVTLIVFAAVPVLIYDLLDEADRERNALLFRIMQEEGRLISEGLLPYLEEFSPKAAAELEGLLPKLAAGGTTIKVLFRPAGSTKPNRFFFVASHPKVSGAMLDAEQRNLVDTGLLSKISESCDFRRSLATDFTNASGEEEVMTYLGSRYTSNGCWVILTSLARRHILYFSPDRQYWQTPELKVALAIYGFMAVLVLSIFTDAWRNLRRFSRVAHALRTGSKTGTSFRDQNRIPELDGVASDFDELVVALRRSEQLIRQAAEENAHALKAPLAVISQSLEPIRRAVPVDNAPGRKSLDLIERSVERLDAQISAARRIEEATAELMDQRMTVIELPRLLPVLVEEYRTRAEDRDIAVHLDVAPGLRVLGNDNLIESVMENVLENALDFSPSHSAIRVAAAPDGGMAVIRIDDEGPGVKEGDRDNIFGHHFSTRLADGLNGNYGIGLWIVRRNVEAMGGTVIGTNLPARGFRIEIRLPRR
ncbi:MAG: histidine kinase [Rhodospirillales bacterium CG15_BIG_FIL_POST_REV_8_21_14_020_66_15]|nr:MAG: histidine kinase [Rhodospirillales bacterium CG15_BIG_FIL_POST_REV_8_21_14_020_66_15]